MSSKRKKKVLECRKKGKTDLEIKQQQKNEVLVRAIIKEAEYLMRCGRLYQAITSVNRVLTNLPQYGLEAIDLGPKLGLVLDPLHESLLATRAEVYLKLCTLDKALKDVNEVLDSNSNHNQALAVRGDVLFQQCHFEHALVNYERGLKCSVEPLTSRFLIGKTRTSESIMKALTHDHVFENIEIVGLMKQYRSPRQRWGGVRVLINSGSVKAWHMQKVMEEAPPIPEEEPNGFNKVKHLADDQRHLRTLICDLAGKQTMMLQQQKDNLVQPLQKYNLKESLEEALQFLDSRERFWASQ